MNRSTVRWSLVALLLFTGILIYRHKDSWILDVLLRHDVPEMEINEIPKQAVLVDCRSEREFELSHIRGSYFYNDELNSEVPLTDTLVVYCSLGIRSESVCRELIEKGYSQVYNLKGGIFQWVNEGRPIVDRDDRETNQIHAYSRFWGLWLNRGEKVYR